MDRYIDRLRVLSTFLAIRLRYERYRNRKNRIAEALYKDVCQAEKWIHDEVGEPESPEEVTGYSVYCVGWNDEQIKRELADAAGESDPAAVVLFKFTGWSRCPEYERAV